jgi:hypothetical protein
MKNHIKNYNYKLFAPLIFSIIIISLFFQFKKINSLELFLYILSFQLFILNIICYFLNFKLFGKLSILIFASIFSLALIETGFKFIQQQKIPEKHAYWGSESDYPVSESNTSYYQTSWLGAQANPGKYNAHKIHPNGKTIYNINYHIGLDRFRVTPDSKAVKPKKINFFGGSFMFGEGVDNDETIPYYFQNFNQDYSVKNYGSHMFGVHEALAILESDMDTDGDIIFLLTAPWHSHRLECIRGESAANKPTYILDSKQTVRRLGTCRDHENSQKIVIGKFSTFFINSFIYKRVGYLFRDKKAQESSIDLYISIISKINEVSMMRGQEFILGFMEADENYFYSSYNNKYIISKIKASGINMIDMTLANKDGKVSEKYVIEPKYEKHPSALANFKRASILTKYLKNKNNINSYE